MNRTEVLEQMTPIMDLRVRDIEHGPRTRVTVTPDMVTMRPGGSGRTIEFAPEGARGLARFTGLPADLATKVRPDTLGRVMTELLERKQRYSLVLKDDRVVDCVKTGTLRTLNPERVLTAVERGIGGDTEFHRVHIMPDRWARLEVIGIQENAVSRGDLIRAGALVAFSPIGTVQPSVQSYVLRLACTNGATSTEVLREFTYGGDGDDIWQFFRHSVRDAYGALDRVINRFRELMAEQVPDHDRSMVLEALIREARLGRTVAAAVRARALDEPPQNSYDMANLITWASSYLIERPTEIMRAHNAVARFVDETGHRRLCPVCHRVS